MFSEYMAINRTLSIDVWQLKCQKQEINSNKLTNATHLCDQNKNNVIETTSCFVEQLSKKVLRILCVWTLKILYSNERILAQ